MGKILLACESSNVTSKAFRERGHLVTSCDILPNDEDQANHYQGDVRDLLYENWDMIIAHPPCTRLCNSGVRWLAERNLWEEMREGAEFFKLFIGRAPKVCIENPIMHKYALEIIGVKQTQTIQPWEHGHTTSKRTCLWLEGLPPIVPTEIIPKEQRTNEIHMATPGKDRWKIRSKSFPGIANAMAQQWGKLLPLILLLLTLNLSASNPPIKCIPGLRDTHLHFLANSHGVPAIGITMLQKGYTQVQSIVAPVIVMSGISLGKEISDKQRGGRISKDDLIADLTGIITGAFITLVVNGLIQHFRENREVERAYRNYKPIEF